MPANSHQAGVLAELFSLLSDPTRVRILQRLQQRPHNVGELCRRLGVAQPTVSHHLRILRGGGLIVSRRAGKEVHYSLDDLSGRRAPKALERLLGRSAVLKLGPMILGLARKG